MKYLMVLNNMTQEIPKLQEVTLNQSNKSNKNSSKIPIQPTTSLETYGSTGVGNSQYDKEARVEDLTDLNELRAQEQSNWDRWANAVPRLISKVGTEILKTPGYLYALGESMSPDVTLAESINNAYLNGLQSLDDKTKEEFAIYKPKSVIDGNIWDNLKSASFYTDEGVDGLGYLVSAMAPGYALKAAGIAGGIAKTSAAMRVANTFGATADKIGQGVELGAQTLLNSTLEAAAETKGFVDKMDKHFVDIFDPNSPNYNPINPDTKQPWTEKEIKDAKDKGAFDIFGANLALLLVPNAIMNKNLLGRFNPTSKTIDKIQDAAGNLVNNPITKKQMAREVLKNMGTSAVFEGFFEEGLEFAVEDYVTKVAKNQTNDDWLNGLANSYADALTTTEGQKSIFLGSLLGSLGGVYGGIQEQKGEKAYNSKLYKTMKENFDGFSKDVSDIYEKDKEGNIVFEDNKPKVNTNKAVNNASEVIKEQISSQLMEAAALSGNKDAYDYYFNQAFNRFALPYLQEEGGLDLLDKHIDRMSSEFIKNQSAMEGIPVNELDENKYKQELKQKARTLNKVYESIENTLSQNFQNSLTNEDPQIAGEFINKLKNTALFETSKQLFYNDKIKELNKEILEFQSALGSDIPQNKIQIQSLQNKVEDFSERLQASIQNYNSILDKAEQRKAFEEYKKEDSLKDSNITKAEEKEKNFETKLSSLKNKLKESGYSDEDIKEGNFSATLKGNRFELNLSEVNKGNIDDINIVPKFVIEKETNLLEELKFLNEEKAKVGSLILENENKLKELLESDTHDEKEVSDLLYEIENLNHILKGIELEISNLASVDSTQTQITGSNETVNPDEKSVKIEFAKAAKPTVFSSAGNHEEAIERNDISQLRWFNTLNRLKNSDNYYLRFVTRDTMPEAFDALASDGKTELQYELDNPETKGVKGVLVDENNNFIKASNNGELFNNGNIVSTTIHTSNHVDKLNPNIVLFEYLMEKGNPYSISDIQKNKEFVLNDEKISKEDLLKKAKEELKLKISNFRETIKSNLDSGVDSFTRITSISNGIPNKLILDVKTNKRQRNNILQNFVKSTTDIARIFIGDNKTTTTLQGKPLSLVSGGTYIENKNGEVTDAINRTLEESEVNLVIDILNYAFEDPTNIKTTIKASKGEKEYSIFYNSNSKEEEFILSKILFYGKAKTENNKKYQIFADYKTSKLFFGESSSIDFSSIKDSSKLKDFLRTKFLHVNKNLLSKGKDYSHPIEFSNNRIKFEDIKAKDGLGGYELMLLRSNILTTDIVPINSNEPQYLQKYTTFVDKISTSINKDVDSSQEADEDSKNIINPKIGSRLAGTTLEESTKTEEPIKAKTFNPKEMLKGFNPKIVEDSDNDIISSSIKGIDPNFFSDEDFDPADFRINNKFNIFFNKERIKNPSITTSEALEYFKKCK